MVGSSDNEFGTLKQVVRVRSLAFAYGENIVGRGQFFNTVHYLEGLVFTFIRRGYIGKPKHKKRIFIANCNQNCMFQLQF